jgi:hypothetical protein
MVVLLLDHLALWARRAPARVVVAPLMTWCRALAHVDLL